MVMDTEVKPSLVNRIIWFSVYQRGVVLALTGLVVAAGVFAFQKLPIDAVPDITNNQVQINALAPALSPFEVEKQVTFTMARWLVSCDTYC
jgi:cobalt-zinc-cadmium resistance protein CzcA